MNMSRLYHKTLEEYLVAPVGAASTVIGKVLSGALPSTVIILLAYVFGAKFAVTAWFLLALVLNCTVFSALGLVAAMIMDSHEEMGNFNTYVLTPMSFLCATFFLPDHLPALLLRWVIDILSPSYALRAAGQGGGAAWLSIGILAVYVAVFIGIGVWKMKKVRD